MTSYQCMLCDEFFSEESGAQEDFVCENCFSDMNVNPFRRTASDIINKAEERFGKELTGEAYYILEDELTEILQDSLGLKE